MPVADDSLIIFLLLFFREKRLDISSESPALQMIHTKYQV